MNMVGIVPAGEVEYWYYDGHNGELVARWKTECSKMKDPWRLVRCLKTQ